MEYVISASLLIAAAIHLLPLSGLLGRKPLEKLYGITVEEPNLEILMRHRAALFGLLGAFLLYAAFQPAMQLPAFIAGFVSVVSFLWIAWSTGKYNAQLARVFTADIIALLSLVVGACACIVKNVQGT
ncbi:MAG: hypothetical protein REI12_08450 [Pedobacter sp.]|nr:hypothetical protein [Pedobacter sp.]